MDSILKELDREMHKIDNLSKTLREIKEYMTLSGFCKPPLSLFPFFGYISIMAEKIPLTLEEMAQLFGYSIYFKGNYYQRNPKSLKKMLEKDMCKEEEISFCIKLASYFDKEGHVLPLDDATQLKETLNSFYTYSLPNIETDETIVTIKSYMEKIKELILKNVEMCYHNSKVNTGENPSRIIEKSTKNRGQNILYRELATYYQDGEIVASCDLNHFRDLLLALEIPTAGAELIYHKMEKFLEQKNEEQIEKYPFSEEEKALLRKARANSHKDNIRHILEDIDEALALFNENPSCLEDISTIIAGDLEILGWALPENYGETIKKNFVQ